MRWKSLCGGLALVLAVVGGCAKKCYLTCEDAVASTALAASGLNELDPNLTALPTVPPSPPPTNALDPERKIRYMALAEAIAISLEQGTTGNQSAALSNLAGGSAVGIQTSSDQPLSFNGRSVGSSDAIRVLALDPAITGVGIEQALTKFDSVWTSSASWQNTDRPIGTALDAFQAGGGSGSGTNAIQQQDSTVTTGLLKPLPTGGVAGITFSTTYSLTNLPARVNPSYRPSLQFAFEQPLLQGYGVEINQLRPAHPGSQLLGLNGLNGLNPTQEGILITRIRFDQQRAEFQRNVHAMVANVEIAYWNLYNSYWQLYSQEQGMRQAYEAWKINSARFVAGRVGIADLAQTRGQYELFRGQRLNALTDLQENERQLRALLSLPIEDGTRLVPSDTPTLAPYSPDWDTAYQESMNLRPELYLARQDVKANQLNLILQENSLLPDLRFGATYDVNDIGNRLDGADGQNAFRNLSGNHFNNWQLQLRLNVPIGFRNAQANVRVAKLQLARSYATLQDQELKIGRFLQQQYRRVFNSYELIRIRRAQREAFAEQLKARFQEFLAGRGTLDILLEAQRFWANALADEYTAIRDYNNVLIGFELAKGTILEHNNITIAEGALPACVQKRAVEHLRQRTAALELKERALPVSGDGCGPECGMAHEAANLPHPKPEGMPSLTEMPKVMPLPTMLPDAPAMKLPAKLPMAPEATPSLLKAEPVKDAAPLETKAVETGAKKASEFGSVRPILHFPMKT